LTPCGELPKGGAQKVPRGKNEGVPPPQRKWGVPPNTPGGVKPPFQKKRGKNPRNVGHKKGKGSPQGGKLRANKSGLLQEILGFLPIHTVVEFFNGRKNLGGTL